MTTENNDFVLIEFMLENNSLSIYVHSDGISPKRWVQIMQNRLDDEIIEGYNTYTAMPIAMSVSHKLCYGILASYANWQWVEKYKNVNGNDAENTTTVQD